MIGGGTFDEVKVDAIMGLWTKRNGPVHKTSVEETAAGSVSFLGEWERNGRGHQTGNIKLTEKKTGPINEVADLRLIVIHGCECGGCDDDATKVLYGR